MEGSITTIKEVAAKAGVSTSTVSHVLNGTRFVSEELQTKVHSAMESLDYFPNQLARSLRSNRTNSIGLVIPEITNPFYAELVASVENTSYLNKFSTVLCLTSGEPLKEFEYIKALSERQIDGIILISSGLKSEYLNILKERDVPLIMVDRTSSGFDIDTITVNEIQGGELATQHLVKLGHRRIACIAGPMDITPSYDRVKGYKNVLLNENIEVDEDLILNGDFSAQSGYEHAKNLFQLSDRPSAIFACNDLMAFGVLKAAKAESIDIPNDISLVGYDDIAIIEYMDTQLTSVKQPINQLGEESVLCILDRIENPDKSFRNITLDLSLKIRETTKQLYN